LQNQRFAIIYNFLILPKLSKLGQPADNQGKIKKLYECYRKALILQSKEAFQNNIHKIGCQIYSRFRFFDRMKFEM
jgi:hypothetical protein